MLTIKHYVVRSIRKRRHLDENGTVPRRIIRQNRIATLEECFRSDRYKKILLIIILICLNMNTYIQICSY
jgi:hypothetical protein